MSVVEMERSNSRAVRVAAGSPILQLRLKARPEAAGRARHALDEISCLSPEAMEAVRLLVSEVVTNSIRHAGVGSQGMIDLRVAPAGRGVRVEVTDRGRGFDPELVPPPRRKTIGGWGLYLVDQLADRWGVDGERATRVWFEIDNASS